MSSVTEQVVAPRAASRPRKPAPSSALTIGLLVSLVITVWAGRGIDFTLIPLFTDLTRGREVLVEFFRPNWGFLARPAVIDAWLSTIGIAVIASLVGCVVALVFAMLASRVTAPNGVVYQITKSVLSGVRSLPDVAYGLLFVAAVGTGALGGITALIMFNIGIAAKLTSETIDAVDPGPVEAAEASGANRVQRARWAVFPQVAPNYLSYCFYVFELNIRASVVIGIVGGGGIGQLLYTQLSRFSYSNISAIVVGLFLVVFVLDRLSRVVRRRLT